MDPAPSLASFRNGFRDYYSASKEKRKTRLDKLHELGLYPGCMHRIVDIIACANLREYKIYGQFSVQPDEIAARISYINTFAPKIDSMFVQDLQQITFCVQEQLLKFSYFSRCRKGVEKLNAEEAIMIIFELAMDYYYKIRSPNPYELLLKFGLLSHHQLPFYSEMRTNYDTDQALFQPVHVVIREIKWLMRFIDTASDETLNKNWINCCKKMKSFAETVLPNAIETALKDYEGFFASRTRLRKHALSVDPGPCKKAPNLVTP